jgi:hypothetical protein
MFASTYQSICRDFLLSLSSAKTCIILMGQTESKVSKKPDSCAHLLQQYTDCVAKHVNGLKEGDDCSREGDIYKECRRAERLANTQSQKESKDIPK